MLEVQDLHTSYDGIRALDGVSLSVEAGEVVALIGSNGAGKSTLINSISGIVRSSTGRILYEGRDIAGDSAWTIARSGLLQVPEGRQILAQMTVFENLDIGRTALGNRAPRFDVDEICELFPILKERRAVSAGSLSGGQQQMLAIGRALMGSPKMLLLDEPTLGLAPLVISEVFDALEAIRTEIAILLVEQNARKALKTADRAYVLDRGRIVYEGSSKKLRDDPSIVAHYLGEVA